MPDDFECFKNKRVDRIYISKAFDEYGELATLMSEEGRKMRIISKVVDSSELHQCVKIQDELVLRVTDGDRQEIKIIFYEDSKDIECITIQRYTKKNGNPHKLSFTFRGDEIRKLYNLIRIVKHLKLDNDDKERLDDQILDGLLLNIDEKKEYLLENPDLIMELARNNITKSDIIALAYRKEQLELFENLLRDKEFFEETKSNWKKKRDEDVWQQFFENNPWIFGYGLNYIFTSNLGERKLEQITTGYSIQESGKRVDALMKTRGLISSLCFVEMKTHKTPLLSKNSYRTECWAISDELAGSISQSQKTIQKAIKSIQTRLEFKDDIGDPTGEVAFLYQPRACVVIGDLDEFLTDHGVNEQKFGSFELFRRNIINPEIITFDELYERAKFIVKHSEESCDNAQEDDSAIDDDIPF